MTHHDSSYRGASSSATRHVGVLPLKADPSFAYTLTWAVAGLLLTSSVAGLLYGPRGLYDPDATTYPALLGQDAVALVCGLPLLLVSARRARRGSVRALLSWMGALFYVAYFWYFYVVGIRFSPFLVVHIALVSTSMYAVLYLVSALNMAELKARFDPGTPIRLIGGFLMTVSVAFALLWLAVIASATLKGADIGAVTRYVIAIDGVVLLPLSFFGGLWLWRGQPLGYALAGLLLVKVVTTCLTLVVTSAVVMHWGQAMDPLQTSMYATGLLVGLGLTACYLRGVSDRPCASTIW